MITPRSSPASIPQNAMHRLLGVSAREIRARAGEDAGEIEDAETVERTRHRARTPLQRVISARSGMRQAELVWNQRTVRWSGLMAGGGQSASCVDER